MMTESRMGQPITDSTPLRVDPCACGFQWAGMSRNRRHDSLRECWECERIVCCECAVQMLGTTLCAACAAKHEAGDGAE